MPRQKSSRSFVFKMKCEVTSNITHDVLTSKDVSYKTYKEICSGEPKKVNIGYNNNKENMVVENSKLMQIPKQGFIFGKFPQMSKDWEVLSKFFLIHNIQPIWLNCESTWGAYDEDLGGWTGCMGKV